MTAAVRGRPEAAPGRALVIGLGASGRAVTRLLEHHGSRVMTADHTPSDEVVAWAADTGHDVLRDEDQMVDAVGAVDVVVPSPGVPEHSAVLRAALRHGVPVWSEPETALRLAPRRLIAITGTNGKTTTTGLVAEMLARDGRPVVACGNIGRPIADAVLGSPDDATLVAELSSFQLRFTERLRPVVGALLNLDVDHLDWHGHQAAYAAAKARIWQAQGVDDWAVASADDAAAARLMADHAPGRRAWFSASTTVQTGVGVRAGGLEATIEGIRTPIVGAEDCGGIAAHHRANLAAAATIALLDGATVDAVAASVRAFRPGLHRGEHVAAIDDVHYVNDSKATNPHAALAALARDEPVVWIAGGLSKGVDLGRLAHGLGRVRHAVLLGDAADELAEVCRRADVEFTRVEDLDEAVIEARLRARPGDVVLLAPACASFDQFRNYAERGDAFRRAVHRLTAPVSGQSS